MVKMFGCCAAKEAATAISIVKLTFQVSDIYAFGNTVTKKYYIITAIMSIFIRAIIRDNETVAWFIMCHFISMHTVLTFIRVIIAYSDFCLATSVYFIFDVLVMPLVVNDTYIQNAIMIDTIHEHVCLIFLFGFNIQFVSNLT